MRVPCLLPPTICHILYSYDDTDKQCYLHVPVDDDESTEFLKYAEELVKFVGM